MSDIEEIGVIGDWSKVVEWKIPDFLALLDSYKSGEYFQSHSFLYASSTWNLRAYLRDKSKNSANVCLYMSESLTEEKAVTYTLGMKRCDESLVEKDSSFQIFRKGEFHGQFVVGDELEEENCFLLPYGTLTITCRMKTEATTNSSNKASVQMKFAALETLSSDFKDLLVNEKKSDITVKVQDTEFCAHRSVLMARSSVFRAMYEHDTSESKTGLLTIPDCDPNSFGDFLKFLYSGKLEITLFKTAYYLYSTSDKYNVQELKSFCVDYMKVNLTVENVCDVVILADKYDDSELQSAAQMFFSHNYRAIFRTSEWSAFVKNNHRLTINLLSMMASVV